MHFGHGEPTVQYTMNDISLERTKEEKDLGVLITDDLQPSSQSAKAAKKAKSALALLHNKPYIAPPAVVPLHLMVQIQTCTSVCYTNLSDSLMRNH